jgi:hypothetical protein
VIQNLKNAFKPNYTRTNGKWIKKPDHSQYYFKDQLNDFCENKLTSYAQKLGIQDIKNKSKMSLIQQILDKRYPIVQNKKKKKDLLNISYFCNNNILYTNLTFKGLNDLSNYKKIIKDYPIKHHCLL